MAEEDSKALLENAPLSSSNLRGANLPPVLSPADSSIRTWAVFPYLMEGPKSDTGGESGGGVTDPFLLLQSEEERFKLN